MRLRCNRCSRSVSNELPDDTVVRAWLECPECIESKAWVEGYISEVRLHGDDGKGGVYFNVEHDEDPPIVIDLLSKDDGNREHPMLRPLGKLADGNHVTITIEVNRP